MDGNLSRLDKELTMADFVFNIAKGKVGYYATLPATNDALIIVLIKATGLEADDTLNNHDDLSALLAASNDEADFTNYVRKVVTSAPGTVDDTLNRLDVTMSNLVWTTAGGGVNNGLAKLIVSYDPDTTTGTDTSLIPMTAHDFTATTDGSDLTAQITAPGFYRAA
jgi:hypothetical protein